MNILCPIKIDCPGTDFPVTNYSSEGEELGAPKYSIQYPPPPVPPGPGNQYWGQGCLGECLSYTSQEEADLCALIQQQLCGNTTEPNGPGVPFPFSSVDTYGTASCGAGSSFSYFLPAGAFLGATQAAANALAQALANEMAQRQRVCLGDLPSGLCVGTASVSAISATGMTVVAWVLTAGSVPTGMTFSNGVVSGTPTTYGTYSFTVRAFYSTGGYASRTYVMYVLAITDTVLPDATEGANYDYTLTSAGGTAPYTYTLVSGGFPLGMSLTSSGLITGVAGEVGVFSPVIKTTDALGRTCTKAFTLTSEANAGCSSIAGTATQTWSESKIITDGYDACEVLQLVNDPDYYGFTQWFTGVEGGSLLVETSSTNGSVNHCVYVKLTVAGVNLGTGEISFTGTHAWTVNAISSSDFTELMVRLGPKAGESANVDSNTADTVVVDDPSHFAAGDEVMLIYYNSSGSADFRIASLPVSEDYTVETGVYLAVGEEDIEWTYNVACQYYLYEVTNHNSTPQIYGFVPYGSTDSGTYQRYMRLDCLASFTGSLTIDAVLYRSGSDDLTDYQAVNYLGATTNYIHETHVTNGVTDIDGNISGWQTDNKPDMVTLGTIYGWYDSISGYTTYPQWAWTEDSATQITAAPTGAGSGTVNDFGTIYDWAYTVVGTGTLSVPFVPGDAGEAAFVSVTADSLIGSAYLNNPTWHPPGGGSGYWDFSYRGLELVKTKLYGLTVGRTYKVTSTLVNHTGLAVVQTDEQTFVAVAGVNTLTTALQMKGSSMTYGQQFDLTAPTIEDVTP